MRRLTLHGEGHHGDLSTPSVNTPEALNVAGSAGKLRLHFGSVDHVSDIVVDLSIRVESRVGESPDGSLGILVSTLSDEPPRRWRA